MTRRFMAISKHSTMSPSFNRCCMPIFESSCMHRSHLCGLDLNLSYPQSGGNFPTINIVSGGNQNGSSTGSDQDDDVNKKKNGSTNNGRHSGSFTSTVAKRHAERVANGWSPRHEENISKRDTWKRDLGGRSNSSIDPWYGCFVWDEMVDYAVNFTYPWSRYLQPRRSKKY